MALVPTSFRLAAALVCAGALLTVAALAAEKAYFRNREADDARAQVRLFDQTIAPYRAAYAKASRDLDVYLRSHRAPAQQHRR